MKSRMLLSLTATALLTVLVSPVKVAAQQQQKIQPVRYTITDLGLGADRAEGINNKGALDYTAIQTDGTVHATFLHKGRKIDLGTLGGPNSSAFFGPSERGQVVGPAETSTPDPNGEDFCFYGTNLICLGFVSQNGQMNALPILGGNNATASDINNRGEVVGWAETNTPDPTCPPPRVLQSPPVIWKNGEVHELPTVSGDPDGVAVQINDKGQIAGASANCTTPFHALRWDEDGHVKDLGNLGGTVNQATGLNNRGQVVGASNLTGDATGHAFLWTEEDGMQDLGTLPGDFGSFAFSINDKGDVVGLSNDIDGNPRAFVWQNGVMTDLNAVIPPAFRYLLVEAFDINDRGEIVGLANDPSTDENHAFLAIPCDEEHADRKGCKGEDAAAVQSDASERPNITLSEHARKLLWQHMVSRYRIPPPGGTSTGNGREVTGLGSSACAAGSGIADDRLNGLSSSDNGSGSPQMVPLSGRGVVRRCIPQGGRCFGPGHPYCCPAPRGHHSYCSNPTGWGTCVES